MKSVPNELKCIAVHPDKPYLAIAGTDGFFSVWNYLSKTALDIEYDSRDEPTFMQYTPNGKCLIVCYSNGVIRFFSIEEEDDGESIHIKGKLVETQESLKVSNNSNKEITGLVIAPDSKKFATMDASCCVCLFIWEHKLSLIHI